MIEEKMAAVVTWLEDELQAERDHPILVIGTFALYFVAACPFSGGNGRMAHLLLQRLLIRAGYDFIPYASLERILEETREEYFNAMDAAETIRVSHSTASQASSPTPTATGERARKTPVAVATPFPPLNFM